MIERGKLVTSLVCAAAFAAGAVVLAPFHAFADSVSALPNQISVTPGGTQLLMEGGGAATFGITVKNTSSQAIGITGAAVAFVKFDGPDSSDRVMSIAQTNTTCPKNNLANNQTCTFTFDVTPVGTGPEKENLNFGITTAMFTVTPNRGPAVSANADFTVRDDHASVIPEPATLTLFATAAGLAALARVRRGNRKSETERRLLNSR